MVDLKIKLPEHFLDEEIRCGYKVSHEMKEIWAVELDLLNEFDRVCKKYGIKYFANGGTLLGAVRHKGFIPWDDDIDIEILREEYNKLCKIAKKEFKQPYFFQTEYTDPGSLRGHAQLRNSETTGILKNEMDKTYTFNQGIFIDIFPFDSIPDDEEEREKFINKINYFKAKARRLADITVLANLSEAKSPSKKIKNLIKVMLGQAMKFFHISNFYYKKMEKYAQRYNQSNAEYVAPVTFHMTKTSVCKKKYFQDSTLLPFENLSVPATVHYEERLAEAFGNWKEFVVGKSMHGGVIFDTSKSYRDYY